jgi:hypothetical protein
MMTINEAIAFSNQLAKRINELSQMRSSNMSESSRSYNGEVTTTKPVYDAKVLDKKVTELQNWQFKLNAHIKSVNAKTEIGLDVPTDALLAPVE